MARRKVAQLNALIAVDKPLDITSHDVVARVRRAVGERRVGHAGTLDPLATGVMVIGIGQATRLLGMLTLDTKSYVAQIRFGCETVTDDAEGEVSHEAPVDACLFEESFARDALARFLGDQMQTPPAYSAISVDGVRSYKRARAGEDVELAPRPVTVHAAELYGIAHEDGAPVWTVGFTVSKGTYIRALARDLGRAVGSAAHLGALRRTASGFIGIEHCLALDGLSVDAARASALDPVTAIGVPVFTLDEAQVSDVLCGKVVAPRGELPAEGVRVALVQGNTLVALGEVAGGCVRPRDVFPQPIEGVRL